MIKEFIKKVADGNNLTREEARQFMRVIMNGKATESQISSYLTAMHIKGESKDEIVGSVEAVRDAALKIEFHGAVDMCGTGGDRSGTFNISTGASFVVATKVPVAKHGNRSVMSKSGSADVLEALGIDILLSPEQARKSMEEVGWAFLFAPQYHKSMKYAAKPRREIGIKTIFNIVGPLANPAFVKRQMMGVYDSSLLKKLTAVFQELGHEHTYLVHSQDDLDEISPSQKTNVIEYHDGKIKKFSILPKKDVSGRITVNSAKESASMILSALNGDEGAHTRAIEMNAAGGLAVGLDITYEEALGMAEEIIDSGLALKKFNAIKKFWSK